ncbi:hypothetical protein COCNU_03G002120 [Cocos nucifera]|uniref:Uncharacterized protein n=1 Tax=Cocos nucifera TaxID=13894 RepID=A0A8K0MY13_COCNU|nr:hypothetical protein COCNU_03G002120 [Cocos nucifera]
MPAAMDCHRPRTTVRPSPDPCTSSWLSAARMSPSPDPMPLRHPQPPDPIACSTSSDLGHSIGDRAPARPPHPDRQHRCRHRSKGGDLTRSPLLLRLSSWFLLAVRLLAVLHRSPLSATFRSEKKTRTGSTISSPDLGRPAPARHRRPPADLRTLCSATRSSKTTSTHRFAVAKPRIGGQSLATAGSGRKKGGLPAPKIFFFFLPQLNLPLLHWIAPYASYGSDIN